VLLAIDVGNTNTKLGVYEGSRLVASSRLTTRREQTADEYGVYTQTLLRSQGVDPAAITGIALSSTVPRVQGTLEEMALRYFGVAALVAEPGVNVPVPILVDYPREVGPDRVVKVVAAVRRHPPPLIVIDFGTATVFDCVSPRGEFIGGAIAPGVAIAAEALTAKAARLFRVELTRPKEAIGRNTVTNIQSGIIYGYAGLVDGLVERMRMEMGGAPTVIATGGLVGLIQPVAASIQVVYPHLTLEGLRIVYEEARLRTAPGRPEGRPEA
jgi:type III pantothenate kinase